MGKCVTIGEAVSITGIQEDEIHASILGDLQKQQMQYSLDGGRKWNDFCEPFKCDNRIVVQWRINPKLPIVNLQHLYAKRQQAAVAAARAAAEQHGRKARLTVESVAQQLGVTVEDVIKAYDYVPQAFDNHMSEKPAPRYSHPGGYLMFRLGEQPQILRHFVKPDGINRIAMILLRLAKGDTVLTWAEQAAIPVKFMIHDEIDRNPFQRFAEDVIADVNRRSSHYGSPIMRFTNDLYELPVAFASLFSVGTPKTCASVQSTAPTEAEIAAANPELPSHKVAVAITRQQMETLIPNDRPGLVPGYDDLVIDTKAIQFRFQMDDGRRFENTMIRYLFTNGAVKDVFEFGIRLD